MWKDWLIAAPIFAFTIWVIVRQFRGHGPSCSHHSVYGIPDDGCNACPAKARCKKKK